MSVEKLLLDVYKPGRLGRILPLRIDEMEKEILARGSMKIDLLRTRFMYVNEEDNLFG